MLVRPNENGYSVPLHDFLMKLKRILEKRRSAKTVFGAAASELTPALLAVL